MSFDEGIARQSSQSPGANAEGEGDFEFLASKVLSIF